MRCSNILESDLCLGDPSSNLARTWLLSFPHFLHLSLFIIFCHPFTFLSSWTEHRSINACLCESTNEWLTCSLCKLNWDKINILTWKIITHITLTKNEYCHWVVLQNSPCPTKIIKYCLICFLSTSQILSLCWFYSQLKLKYCTFLMQ